jgi:hypothetical protein
MKFEYTTVSAYDVARDPQQLTNKLNKLGEEGWELVAVKDCLYILKRGKQ